jgi:hypothetical protein
MFLQVLLSPFHHRMRVELRQTTVACFVLSNFNLRSSQQTISTDFRKLVTMSMENILSDMPTEQLVLKLLSELASRVEKLEKMNKAADKSNTSEGHSQAPVSPGNNVNTIDQQNPSSSASGIRGGEDKTDQFLTRGELPGGQYHCAHIPYGYLLDGETPLENMQLMSIDERAKALQISDPSLFVRLKDIGIAGVPADGRFAFKNFWSQSSSHDLDVAIEVTKYFEEVGGSLSVIDFVSPGTSITYGPKIQIMGQAEPIPGYSARPISRAPQIRITSDVSSAQSAPWNRLM